MPKLKVNDDDLDLLTDEERIGLKEYQAELDAELAAEDAEIAAAAAGDAEEPEPTAETPPPDEPEEEPEPEGEPEPDEEPEPEEEPAEEPEPEEEPVAAGEPEAEPDEVVRPAPMVATAYKLTAAEEARFAAIDTQLDEIAVQFDDGEITAREMRDKSKALLAELDELKEKRAVAKMSGKVVEDTWYRSTVPLFLAEHPEYVDGSLRHKLLDSIVRDLQAAHPDHTTDAKILVEAHKQIVAELGPVNGHAKPAKKKTPAKAREMPPSINNIPASDQTPVVAVNKFARLEKLRGADYERALARLSPADRDMYLQGA